MNSLGLDDQLFEHGAGEQTTDAPLDIEAIRERATSIDCDDYRARRCYQLLLKSLTEAEQALHGFDPLPQDQASISPEWQGTDGTQPFAAEESTWPGSFSLLAPDAKSSIEGGISDWNQLIESRSPRETDNLGGSNLTLEVDTNRLVLGPIDSDGHAGSNSAIPGGLSLEEIHKHLTDHSSHRSREGLRRQEDHLIERQRLASLQMVAVLDFALSMDDAETYLETIDIIGNSDSSDTMRAC